MATVNYIPYRNQSRTALRKVSDYIQRADKTEEQKYVSGISCSPQFATEEFLSTRAINGKASPIWFYHYTQSFSPREVVTPDKAHALALEFAAKAWPDSEVLVATHTDAAHLHSHFLVNAVCHETGKMLRQGPRTLERLRSISDELCLRYGLSVLRHTQKKSPGVGNREYRAAAKGQSWKLRLMSDIDLCMGRAGSREEFIRLMQERGYGLRWTDSRKNITYTAPNGMRCRDEKLHEKKYLKENLENEFKIREGIYPGGTEDHERRGYERRLPGGEVHNGVGQKLDGSAEPAFQIVFDTGSSYKKPVRPDDEAGRGTVSGGDEQEESGSAAGYALGDRLLHTTGWEHERELFLRRRPAGYECGEVLEEYGELYGLDAEGYDYEYRKGFEGDGHDGQEVDNSHGDSLHGGYPIVGGLVRLGHAAEGLGSTAPVTDTATRPRHTDRKTLRREMEKKIALGHKEDDHEERIFEQRM